MPKSVDEEIKDGAIDNGRRKLLAGLVRMANSLAVFCAEHDIGDFHIETAKGFLSYKSRDDA